MSTDKRAWIAEIPVRGKTTVLIYASSRRAAEAKLLARDFSDDDVLQTAITQRGIGTIVREDKRRVAP